MSTVRFRLMLAVTLDGFIADRRGGVDWLHAFPAADTGFDAFFKGIASIVMGRKTYEQTLTFGPWPFAGKRVTVLTRRAFTPPTPNTQAWTGGVEALADDLASRTRGGDVWIAGGGAVARAFLAAGRLDTLELAYVPILLGDGVPLFGPGTMPADLTLSGTERFANGIVRLDYEVKEF